MDPTSVRRIRFAKSPTDLTPVTGDFRGALDAIDNDSLSTTYVPHASVIRNDGAVSDLYVVGGAAISPDATRVTVWLAAGSVGFEYLVSITVMSVDGQEFTRSFILPVGLR
jgi:hypothetical protein